MFFITADQKTVANFAILINDYLDKIIFKSDADFEACYSAFHVLFDDLTRLQERLTVVMRSLSILQANNTTDTMAVLTNYNLLEQEDPLLLFSKVDPILRPLTEICDPECGYFEPQHLPCFIAKLKELYEVLKQRYASPVERLGHFIDNILNNLEFNTIDDFALIFTKLDLIATGQTGLLPLVEQELLRLSNQKYGTVKLQPIQFQEVLVSRINILKSTYASKDMQTKRLSKNIRPPTKARPEFPNSIELNLMDALSIAPSTEREEFQLLALAGVARKIARMYGRCINWQDYSRSKQRQLFQDFAALDQEILPIIFPIFGIAYPIETADLIDVAHITKRLLAILHQILPLIANQLPITSCDDVTELIAHPREIENQLVAMFNLLNGSLLKIKWLKANFSHDQLRFALEHSYVIVNAHSLALKDLESIRGRIIALFNLYIYKDSTLPEHDFANDSEYARLAREVDIYDNIVLLLDVAYTDIPVYCHTYAHKQDGFSLIFKISCECNISPIEILNWPQSIVSSLIEHGATLLTVCSSCDITFQDFFALPLDEIELIICNKEYIHRLNVLINYYFLPKTHFLQASKHQKQTWLDAPFMAVQFYDSRVHKNSGLQAILSTAYASFRHLLTKFSQSKSLIDLDALSELPYTTLKNLLAAEVSYLQAREIYTLFDKVCLEFRTIYIDYYIKHADGEKSKVHVDTYCFDLIFDDEDAARVKTFFMRCMRVANELLSAPREYKIEIKKYFPQLYELVESSQTITTAEEFLEQFAQIESQINLIMAETNRHTHHRYQYLLHYLTHSNFGKFYLFGQARWIATAQAWHEVLYQIDYSAPVTFFLLDEEDFQDNTPEAEKALNLLNSFFESLSALYLNFIKINHKAKHKAINERDALFDCNRGLYEFLYQDALDTNAKNSEALAISSVGLSIYAHALLNRDDNIIRRIKNLLQGQTRNHLRTFMLTNGFATTPPTSRRKRTTSLLTFYDDSTWFNTKALRSHNSQGETPLTQAILCSDRLAMIGLLVHGAIADEPNKQSLKPIEIAISKGLQQQAAELYQILASQQRILHELELNHAPRSHGERQPYGL